MLLEVAAGPWRCLSAAVVIRNMLKVAACLQEQEPGNLLPIMLGAKGGKPAMTTCCAVSAVVNPAAAKQAGLKAMSTVAVSSPKAKCAAELDSIYASRLLFWGTACLPCTLPANKQQ